jgi:hypothetical protein
MLSFLFIALFICWGGSGWGYQPGSASRLLYTPGFEMGWERLIKIGRGMVSQGINRHQQVSEGIIKIFWKLLAQGFCGEKRGKWDACSREMCFWKNAMGKGRDA